MLTITLLGTAATMPLPDRALSAAYTECRGHGLLLDCGEGTQAAARRAGVNLMRADFRPAGSAADAWCAGAHPPAGSAWPGWPCRHLGGGARPHRAAALSGAAPGADCGYAAAARPAFGQLVCGSGAASLCHKAPGAQSRLPAGTAPGGKISAGACQSAGCSGAAMEAFAAGRSGGSEWQDDPARRGARPCP